MPERGVAQPCSGAALRAVPHVQRCCLSSSYLLPAHFANAALTRFFFLPLPPSLSVFPVEMLRQCFPFSFKCEVSYLLPIHTLHTLTCLQVVLLGWTKFTPFFHSLVVLVLAE